jgi:hypothetical protein
LNQWLPAERAQRVRHEDNLRMEGSIEISKKEWATKGEKSQVVRHADNLKQEGEFSGRQQQPWSPAEKLSVVKHQVPIVIKVSLYS